MHSHKHTNITEQLCSQEIQKSYTKCYFEDILHITIYHSVKAPNTNIMQFNHCKCKWMSITNYVV